MGGDLIMCPLDTWIDIFLIRCSQDTVFCGDMLMIGKGGGSSFRGISNSPLVLRRLVMMILLFFSILTWYLEKIVMKTSLQSWPMESSESIIRLLNRKSCCALADTDGCSSRVASKCGVMILSFATVTGGPMFYVYSCILTRYHPEGSDV